jgi:hypothetical protein
MTKYLAITGALALLVSGALSAQETPRFTGSIGGGFTTPIENTGHNTDYGWNVNGGVGVNFGPYVGVLVDLGYNSLGVNHTALTNLGYAGGNLNVFSATLDPIIHLTPKRNADIYLIGGGGIYHRVTDFTQPTVVVGTAFNPFFGFFPTAFPAQRIVASSTVNRPGIDAGIGVAFGSRWHGKFFAEARYNRIFLGHDRHTEYVPVTFGFRW